jgi:hypothetical protein
MEGFLYHSRPTNVDVQKLLWKHCLPHESSCSKKLLNIKMNFQFVMNNYKFYILHLVCQCAKLGLLLKLFLAPYCQLSSNVSSAKAKPIGSCLMHFTFTLCITMKNVQTIIQVVNQPLIWCDFDWKLYEFKLRMMTQVCNVLAHFLDPTFMPKHTTCWLSRLTHGSKTWRNVIRIL